MWKVKKKNCSPFLKIKEEHPPKQPKDKKKKKKRRLLWRRKKEKQEPNKLASLVNTLSVNSGNLIFFLFLLDFK